MKKTQDTLGKIIKKPPLTEKLLNKPPFRFLHDVITEVIRTTEFLKGLFTAEEMDSKNVTSKEAKIAFLQKVIDCVSIVGNESLAVRPNKVIAGHEPENTNELLQFIARCIRKKLSSEEAVEMVLKGKGKKQKPKTTANKSSAEPKPADTNQEEKERDRKNRQNSAEKVKDRSSDQKRRSARSKDKENVEREANAKEQERERRRKERKSRAPEDENVAPTKPTEEEVRKDDYKQSEPTESAPTETKPSTASSRGPRPASAKGQRRRPRNAKPEESSDGEATHAPQTLLRPPSARPGAPRIKKRADLVEDRIDSGGQHRTAPIIVDKDTDSAVSDDDAQFVVEEEQVPLHELTNDAPVTNGLRDAGDSDEEHGGLVKKILETKKELEYSAAGAHSLQKHTEIERSNVMTAQQKKERELVMKEIEQLRNSVQKLCQSVVPLAKIIDYIQEDMDAMQNELKFWKSENKQHALKLQQEESVTKHSIEPLNHELQELEQNIASYRNLMAATKANIIKNDDKIRKMVVAVATRS